MTARPIGMVPAGGRGVPTTAYRFGLSRGDGPLEDSSEAPKAPTVKQTAKASAKSRSSITRW